MTARTPIPQGFYAQLQDGQISIIERNNIELETRIATLPNQTRIEVFRRREFHGSDTIPWQVGISAALNFNLTDQ